MGCFGTNVELGKSVPGEDLERILIAAAGDVGWRARVKDKYEESYRLGSVHREERYASTDVHLRGIILPKLKVNFWKGRRNDRILLYSSLVGPSAGRKEVERYLSAVSGRVGEYQDARQ